ncbi:hypothetical protein M1N22_02905 [Dehalococcoidia bacterium]|nr:hypothetical protein [Dehalococcoidia bacterium]MCL0063618.1 hypothetical protein [Dehalococcoidia bacterium]MCL0090993.1 hypothetical protein [Dehalococcoidia bacterium]
MNPEPAPMEHFAHRFRLYLWRGKRLKAKHGNGYKIRSEVETKRFSDTVADVAIERTTWLLAERIADRVVKALMEGGFDKQLANALLVTLKREMETEE